VSLKDTLSRRGGC